MWLVLVSVGPRSISSLLNAAAGVIKRSDHVTTIARPFALARVPERIRFKLCLMVFKAVNHLAPEYITNCSVPVSNTARRAGLRSSTHPKMQSLLSQERLKLRTASLADPFTGSIRTQAREKFWRKGSVGVSRDCPNFFEYLLLSQE